MTRYTVVWPQGVEDELAELWLASADRGAVTAAVDWLDRELAEDAPSKGIELREGLRAVFVPPLRVLFAVREPDRVVEVLRVRLLSREKRDTLLFRGRPFRRSKVSPFRPSALFYLLRADPVLTRSHASHTSRNGVQRAPYDYLRLGDPDFLRMVEKAMAAAEETVQKRRAAMAARQGVGT